MSCFVADFQGQNYEKLKQESLQGKHPFTDVEFEANDASIGNAALMGMVWKRPQEINPNPKFIKNGITLPDVCQQELGDCWFVAAAACLTLHPKLLERVVPLDQTFDDNPGIFRFRFWEFGQWVEVVVDDWLPTVNGKLHFAKSTDNDEFWMPLLEKAYAKLKGCYQALHGGSMRYALVDLTGGIGERVVLQDSDLYFNLCKTIEKALERKSVLAAGIKGDSGEVSSPHLKGLPSGHAYSIIGFREITVEEKKVKLLKLRNPWGQTEWTGDWSDNDVQNWTKLKKLDCDLLEELFEDKDDGEFWMNEHDFRTVFNVLDVCHLSADAPKEGGKSFRWESSSFQGHGLKHQSFDILWMNPQFHVKLLEPDEGHHTCTLLVSLTQKDQRRKRPLLTIGYAVYKVTQEYVKQKNQARRQDLFTDLKPLHGSPYTAVNEEELTKRFELSCGDYLIIPMNLSSEAEAKFLLQIFTEKKHNCSDITLEKPQGSANVCID